MTDDYEVGYKKPPKATQFKPGQSGNPAGRPKSKPADKRLEALLTAIDVLVEKNAALKAENNRLKRQLENQRANTRQPLPSHYR
jgi:hypothetical protein